MQTLLVVLYIAGGVIGTIIFILMLMCLAQRCFSKNPKEYYVSFKLKLKLWRTTEGTTTSMFEIWYLTCVTNGMINYQNLTLSFFEEECIPVGCVPSAAVAVSPVTHAPPPTHHTHPLPHMPPPHHACPLCHAHLPLPQMPPPFATHAPPLCCAHPLFAMHAPPPCGQTDTCELWKHNLSATTVADGKYSCVDTTVVLNVLLSSHYDWTPQLNVDLSAIF